MNEHVGFQPVVLNETLPADFTFERFFTCVNTNVSLQVLLHGEAPSTRLTCKHFPSVNQLVHPERPPPYKSFATHRAFVRIFTSMSAFMALQRERVPETLPALGAFVRLFNTVYDLVSLQVGFSFEGLPTGGAGERPCVCVCELVSLQLHFCFERLLTELALERSVLLLLVPQQVVLKSRRVPEFSRALVAGERPLVFVSVHVLRQMKLPVEALVTHITYKQLPFPCDFCFLCASAVGVFGFCRVCCGTIICRV